MDQDRSETETDYDRVSYPSHPFGETHPDHLGTIGTLFGMTPPTLEGCRVLELGCGDGANLIPIAFQWPESEFVGIDLSESAVRKGNDFIAKLGLRNITLRHFNIMDVTPEFGTFDFITAHGVYSWVPQMVREKMLSIFKQNLSPQGIVFVSYNCYPGCFSRDIARHIMRYHVRGVTDARERVQQSRALMKFLAEASEEKSIYGFELRNQLDRINGVHDDVLFHDDLSDVASPFFLYQVAEDAAQHGLQYLTDSIFSTGHLGRLSKQARERLSAIPDHQVVTREQYADFVEGRAFRESLFCHAEVKLQRGLDPKSVRRCHLATSAAPPEDSFDPAAEGVVTFKTGNGSTLSTDHRLSKAVIHLLGAVYPETVSFSDAVERALAALGPAAGAVRANLDEEQDALAKLLLRAFAAGQFELYLSPARLTTTIEGKPQASLLARRQAEAGLLVTNLRHRSVSTKDDTVRRFLTLVDGTRTVDDLVTELNATAAGSGEGASPAITREGVEQNLGLLAKLCLLVPER